MSLDRSLKSANSLIRHRNVLTRAERLDMLKDQEKWSEEKNSAFGLPKVAHRKMAVVKAVKEETAEGAATATAGVAPAAAGKGAPAAAAGAKGAAAPSAGGKAAAPAAGKAAPAAKKK